MLIYDQMEFHNVTALVEKPGLPGLVMQRFPDYARESVNRDVADLCRSVEIRFYLEENEPSLSGGKVYLLSRSGPGEAVVFFGHYQLSGVIALPAGVITPVPVCWPEALEKMPAGRFPNRVCRIFLNTRSAVSYVGREWFSCRPPRPQEKPEKTLVCYGSSITHGGVARSNCNCYTQLTARLLGMDALNLGQSGSCNASAQMADFIAGDVQGDVFFLELGANMWHRVAPDEYARRVRYLLRTVAQAHPDKPVLAMALYPWHVVMERDNAYARKLHEVIAGLNLPNLHEVDGWDLLPDCTGLSADGLHPSDWGHMVIAQNLARTIQRIMN